MPSSIEKLSEQYAVESAKLTRLQERFLGSARRVAALNSAITLAVHLGSSPNSSDQLSKASRPNNSTRALVCTNKSERREPFKTIQS